MIEEFTYEGNDLKYAISMEAPGFSMVDDDWSVDIKCGNKVLVTYRKENCIVDDNDQYYIAIEHDYLKPGILDIVFRAEVPDMDFVDGIRSEVDKKRLIVMKKI